MRVVYTRQIGDTYESWEASTSEERESEIHAINALSSLFNRVPHDGSTMIAPPNPKTDDGDIPF